MAKIKIPFNGVDYQVDESALADVTTALRTHLSTVMNGEGTTITLGNQSYNVDSAKLQAATNDFTSHLATIAGSGAKVMVNGREYGIDSTKVAGAVSSLQTTFSNLASGGGSTPDVPTEECLEGDGAEYYTLAPTALTFRSTEPLNEFQEVKVNGQVVDPSNYTLEEGSTIVTLSIDYLKTLPVGDYNIEVVSANNAPSGGFTVVEPELNEHGFYYNQPYTGYVAMLGGKKAFFLREDGTLDVVDVASGNIETGTFTCNGKNASMTISIGTLTGTWSDDGKSIYCNELQVAASLGDTSIAADEDYIYIYREELGGYEVRAIDKTQAEYGAIKTGINGIDTVKLVDNMFYRLDGVASALTNIVIPDSVVIIGDNAFKNCTNLTSVTVPYGVTTIGDGAFYGCSYLRNIIIPDSVTNIENSAFCGAGMVELREIPGSVSVINDGTFQNSRITDITLGEGITNIGAGAFSNCTHLRRIEIPSSVVSIGDDAFYYCGNLMNITYNGTISQWMAIEKGSRWDEYTAMYRDSGLNGGGSGAITYRNYTVHCIDGDFDSNGVVIS